MKKDLYDSLSKRMMAILAAFSPQREVYSIDEALGDLSNQDIEDLTSVYVQQKNIDQACEYAMSAIDIAAQIGSKVLLQRLLSLRNTLEPWEETCSVQDLDRAIGPLLLPEKHQDEETMS